VNDAIDIALWIGVGGIIIDWARIDELCTTDYQYGKGPNTHKIKKENQTIEMNNAIAAIKAIISAYMSNWQRVLSSAWCF